MKTLYIAFAALLSFTSLAQEQTLKLKSGDYTTADLKDSRTFSANELVKETYYRIALFEEVPSTEAKSRMESFGITFVGYLPERAFIIAIDRGTNLNDVAFNAIEKVVEILPEYKVTYDLLTDSYNNWAVVENGHVDIVATYFQNLTQDDVVPFVSEYRIVNADPVINNITLRVPISSLDELYSKNCFSFFSEIGAPGKPENNVGRTNHRSSFLRSEAANGLFYRGEGVNVMMQDDGLIGAHIDFQGRADQSNCSGCSSSSADSHGDHVAGTIMGAGNLDPKGRGMADGVKLFVYGSSNGNYNSVPSLYDNDSVVITSKSYSSGCNSGYDSDARKLDQQIRNMPALTHVFSAGNDGASDCGYGAGAGWGNITGGHKSGKNVIAVGNLTMYDGLSGSSSRGPATDGRIKPDICGVGSSVYSTYPDYTYASISGTSMSCPGVAGTIAQLYEAYRDDFGMNPHSSLIKASVLNTGEDLGNSGPDFKYGWGRINAKRAYETFHENLFIYDSLSQGGNNSHTINVPAGVEELRVMVYWMDFEASINASPALVNNIDMTLTDPSTSVYLPWVLDSSPNATALNSVATQGVDNLNNMEQVTIQNPAAGAYQVDLTGTNIPQGPQQYYVVYYFVRDNITVIHPNGGEPFEPQSSELIRWDAKETTDDYILEYTTDDGATWNSIGTANSNRLYYNWSVPATLTGLAKVRVSRLAVSDESDEVFSIIDVPNNLDLNWSCPDSLNLTWDLVSGATSYEVSMLGNKYMDSVGTSLTDNITLQVPATTETWFSVKAMGPDNAISERHIAIKKEVGEYACLWSTPQASFTIDCDGPGTGYCVNLTNTSNNADGTSSYTWYFPGGTPATSTDENPQVCYPTPGDYDVALVVDNGFDIDSIYTNNALTVYPTPTLPYFEGFENYTTFFNNDYWTVNNIGGTIPFDIITTASLSGSNSARLRNYNQNGAFEDELISGPLDLSSLSPSDDITLSFRYAYKKKSASNDEWLKVFVTTSCVDSWVQRKTIHGDQLSNLTYGASWTPSSDADWTTVHMTNVTSSYFTSDFRFKFKFESDNGNNFYLDNINIYEGAPSEELIFGLEENELINVSLYPNPADHELNISYSVNNSQVTIFDIKDVSGKIVQNKTILSQTGNNLAIFDTSELSSGVYLVEIITGDSKITKRVIIK